MYFVHILLILVLARVVIAQIREGSDWFAALSIMGIAANVASIAGILAT